MTLGSEINHIIGIIFGQEGINQLSVADITLYENHVRLFDVTLKRKQVARIGKGIKYDYLHVRTIFPQNIFYKIGADKPGTPCYKVRFHFFSILSVLKVNQNFTKQLGKFVSLRLIQTF